ncbi:hypothetical protein Plec18167_006227 [Paecilomyces lecythidis]|uniref:PQ loop repeat protein n=1 Tax=Paecilomyces lecythidis TaxID=3004212 RepID=A0ABR3XD45_9EURO
MDPLPSRCVELESPSYTNFSISLLILIGILVSYLPQHYRIISLRSSFGISPYFVLLGTTSGTFAFANILVLPLSAQDVACCKAISGIACFAGLLGIFQAGAQWLCFCIILVLFVVYFPRATSATSPTHSAAEPESSDPPSKRLPGLDAVPTYRTALIVTFICIVHAIVVAIISVALSFTRPSALQGWANFMGVLAAILASLQYFPQIYTTLRLRRVGSLSIPMMCIQTPGSFVWAASLAARYGMDGWSTWGLYIVTALLQGSLLFMGIYFEYISPKETRDEGEQTQSDAADSAHSHEREPSEETPLLESP